MSSLFRSGYHTLLGRTAFACFNADPHYAYLKLKMPGPRGVITVNGIMERSLRTKEHSATLVAEVQGGVIEPKTKSAAKPQTLSNAYGLPCRLTVQLVQS